MGPPAQHRIEAEIFAAGHWNGETFTEADLEQIAANFERLRHLVKPPLKFGHDEGQTLLGQRDGDPALGWVDGLRVAGGKLIATFAGVPTVVHEAIRAGRYRRVSAELYFDVRLGAERLGKALKAVALLGADLPAVTNLEDLTAFLTERPAQGLQVGTARVFTLRVNRGLLAAPQPERDTMAETSPPADLVAELAELRAYKAEQERLRSEEFTERTRLAFRTLRDQAAADLEAQVRAGRLSPHFRQRLLAEIEGQAQAFSEGRAPGISFELVLAFIRQCPPLLPQGEVGHAAGPEAAGEMPPDNPSAELARRASAKMAELNLTYAQAAEYVLQTNPELSRAYHDFVRNPN